MWVCLCSPADSDSGFWCCAVMGRKCGGMCEVGGCMGWVNGNSSWCDAALAGSKSQPSDGCRARSVSVSSLVVNVLHY